MNEKLKEAFELVQAENELKKETKDFIFRKTKGYQRRRVINYKHLVSAFICIIFLSIGGYRLYFTPTVNISLDINPSIELGVNRFNHIISLESYNSDGQDLLKSLDIKYMNYSNAIDQILKNADISSLLSNDEIMTIAVVGTDNLQSKEIYTKIKSCTKESNSTYCYYADVKEVEAAHEMGLSYGKYQAFLELQALKPDITAAKVQKMTMREIRNLINELSDNAENKTHHFDNGHHGNNKHGKNN